MKLSKFLNIVVREWKILLFAVLFLTIFSFRILNLDADVPNWGMTHYMPIDEGSYSLMALNKIDYGTVDPSDLFDGMAPYVAPQLRNNLIGNVITYISFCIFGDTYYGLRMPSVLYALILFVGIAFLMRATLKKAEVNTIFSKITGFLLIFLLLVDFELLVSSRVCENSLLRADFVIFVIILYYILIKKSEFKRYFAVAFTATISIFLVYITNAFLLLAVGITLFFEALLFKKCKLRKGLLGIISGSCLALVISEIYYMCVWETTALANMFSTIQAFTKANAFNSYSSATNISALIDRIVAFISSDIFLYNLPIVFLFLIFLPFTVCQIWKQKDTFATLSFIVVSAFFIQTLVAEDVVIKKFLVIYSCVLLLVYFSIIYCIKLYDLVITQIKFFKYGIIAFYLLLGWFVVYKIYSYRRYGLLDNTVLDFEPEDFTLIYIGVMITAICALLIFISFFNKKLKNIYRGVLITCILTSIFVNITFSWKYVFENPTYTEKQVMISLGKTVGDDYVVGEYANGYRLYNDIKSIPLASYEDIKKFLEMHPDFWYFDYYFSDDSRENYFDAIPLQNSKYTGVPKEIYKREYQNYGDKRSVCLYTIELKEEFKQHSDHKEKKSGGKE